MDEAAARAAVVAAARAWIGTPYHHMADVKGVGVRLRDAAGARLLSISAWSSRSIRAPIPRDWHLHRGEERYLGFLLARAREVAAPLPGDVVLFRYGRCFSHGGIVTQPIR